MCVHEVLLEGDMLGFLAAGKVWHVEAEVHEQQAKFDIFTDHSIALPLLDAVDSIMG